MLSFNSEFVAEADEIAFWNFVAKISEMEQYTSLTAKGTVTLLTHIMHSLLHLLHAYGYCILTELFLVTVCFHCPL